MKIVIIGGTGLIGSQLVKTCQTALTCWLPHRKLA